MAANQQQLRSVTDAGLMRDFFRAARKVGIDPETILIGSARSYHGKRKIKIMRTDASVSIVVCDTENGERRLVMSGQNAVPVQLLTRELRRGGINVC